MNKVGRPVPLLMALLLVAPILAAACGKTVGETIDDATITARVKTALLNEPELGTSGVFKIDVDTFKGVVTLSGAVKSTEERDRAIAIARKIKGVRDVKSTLQISSQLSADSSRQPRLKGYSCFTLTADS